NEKIEDINGCPKNRSQMIENIDACLSFLAAKGINIQGLSAEEIRNGNLKAILGLFFSLSRYKQQQQQPQKQQAQHHPSQQAGPPSQCQVGVPQQQVPPSLQTPCQQTPQAAPHQFKAQPEMQSRLPGPTTRVSAAGSEAKARGSISANSRRSQSFNNYDKSKPGLPPPTPTSSNDKDPADSPASQPTGMNENVSSSVQSCSSTVSCNNSSAIPQPSSAIKPWRSKSLSAKHTATSSMLSVKQPNPEPPKPTSEIAKTTPNNQKSMLEKLKLFNSKGGSKAGGTTLECPGSQNNSCEKLEMLLSFEESEEIDATNQNGNNPGSVSSSPKIALKGIAQRTFSRALTNKKSSPKGNEKDKEKQKEKEKDKSKDVAKRTSMTEKLDLKEEPKEEQTALVTTEMPKKSSKIASFIPKGGKLNSAKKEVSAPSHSGIPKPGMKTTTGKSSSAPIPTKEGERSRSGKASSGLSHQKSQLDSRHSSSSSSLASSEGKGVGGLNNSSSSQAVNGTAAMTHTTGSNTVSVQLPHPQQQYSHPNTATVAPFMYRSQTDNEGNVTAEASTGGVSMDSALYVKTGQPALEDLSGEDPETRRLRTVKNIADLRQNLEETMSSLRGTQVTHSVEAWENKLFGP
ncbi:PREDICTED: neuron navigator 2-like, partial [Nestor notabilis]|uniref:neuron navigator 2-like n=1 Tax=Nestor notabilis TaxID=176057 RepID=UPI0005232953